MRYKDIDGRYWANIQRAAKARKYDFEITLKYIWDLYLKQNKKCAISGLPIQFAYDGKKKQKRTASLDRIDNSKGYIKGNVQWVLYDINLMKHKLSMQELIQLCKVIADYN